MTEATIRASILAVVAGIGLSGCADGTGPFAGGPSTGASDAAGAPVGRAAMPGRMVERDVEAPEVFEATDQALWDGRPSLGGVWVASPDAVDPERVLIRNPANGNFVIGALFRRERLNPGPTLQISSDAAAALGILAGAPTRIEVVALRRTEATETPPAAALSEPAAALPLSTETAPETTAETPASAPAPAGEIGAEAVAAIGRSTPEVTPPAETPEAVTETVEATSPEPAPKKKRKWFWQKPREVEPIAAALPSPGDVAPPDAAGPIASTALPAPGAAPAEPAAPPVAAAASSGGAVVQIGFFSIEQNAQRAVDRLAAAGIPARILTEEARGKTFWRVVAGPGADAALLGKVKSAGFADAYFVNG